MNELIKNYIGKEVVIYVSSSGVSGVVTKIEDNWIEVENKNGQKQLLNADYISRIQEYPRTRKARRSLWQYKLPRISSPEDISGVFTLLPFLWKLPALFVSCNLRCHVI
ncbi:DUF6897 domain-containing protein [Ruminococcus flavefaciens]|uniref:DUF6897 domain-containing protein n=1 Tax=Ruminococcus flavefaciens TaxID=1265 RepID=UPI000318987C|nr:hypothetical protein [Ruminococcus flavefaciens]